MKAFAIELFEVVYLLIYTTKKDRESLIFQKDRDRHQHCVASSKYSS